MQHNLFILASILQESLLRSMPAATIEMPPEERPEQGKSQVDEEFRVWITSFVPNAVHAVPAAAGPPQAAAFSRDDPLRLRKLKADLLSVEVGHSHLNFGLFTPLSVNFWSPF